MPDWTVLKLEMASCWKVSWNVDPLALSVPLRAELLDEEHAARVSANATAATPAVVTCCLHRCCIFSTPLFPPAAMSAASDGRSACKPWCASTVCPRWQYLRANVKWTKRGQKVNLWCLGLAASSAAGWKRQADDPRRLPQMYIRGRCGGAGCGSSAQTRRPRQDCC